MAAHYRIEGTTNPCLPFEFARALDMLKGFPPTLGLRLVVGNGFYQAARIMERTVLFHVRGCNTPEGPVLLYTLHSHEFERSADLGEQAVHWLRAFLSLDDDLEEFYRLAQGDPGFAPVVQQLHGYHPVKFGSPFEAAAWAIVSQRNRMSTARRMYQNLLKTLGHCIRLEGHDYWAFPDPEEVAPLSEAALPPSFQSLRRGEYVLDAARAFAAVDYDFLRSAPDAGLEHWLRGIRGIGPWSARFVLLRALGRYAVFPEDDRTIIGAASLVYGGGLTLTPREVRRIAEGYGSSRGYWAHYLRVWAQGNRSPHKQ